MTEALVNSREKPMLRVRAYASIGTVLILLAFPAYAASDARETVEKTIPQGEDPPGTDEEQQTAPPAEHKGVIPPPPMGDEGIYTKVPNPEAGHDCKWSRPCWDIVAVLVLVSLVCTSGMITPQRSVPR
jgi:hypothetical protein